jgi:uncharacterized membrane-anchored protein
MDATMKAEVKRAIALLLAFLLLFFGGVYALGASTSLRELAAMSRGLITCMALLVVCGLAMLSAGIWLVVTLGRNLRALWLGGSASALCGVVVLTGVLSKVIPCAGPS